MRLRNPQKVHDLFYALRNPQKVHDLFGRFRNARIKKAMGQNGHIGVTNVTQIFSHYVYYTIIIGESQIQNVTYIT